MSVGIVIVTHGGTGAALMKEAEYILGKPLTGVESVPFTRAESHAAANVAIHAAIERADSGDGVLVLTDLVGSSPTNRASVLLEYFDAIMVTGINLPMLLRVWNYRDEPLASVARKAVEGGRRGIKIIQK
jgi:PTS system ascorbate-specific IIA component